MFVSSILFSLFLCLFLPIVEADNFIVSYHYLILLPFNLTWWFSILIMAKVKLFSLLEFWYSAYLREIVSTLCFLCNHFAAGF